MRWLSPPESVLLARVDEELEPVLNLDEKAFGYLCLVWCQGELAEEFAEPVDGHVGQFGDVFASYLDV